MGQPVRKGGYSVDAQGGSNIAAGRYSSCARCLADNAVAAEPKKEETITLPRAVVQDQTNPYVPPQSSLLKFPEPVKDTLQSITIVAQRLI
jgi:outer membrane receptor for monomeric catechols